MADNISPPASLTNRHMDLPKGRWAQRLDAGGITVKSVYDSDSIIQVPLGQGNAFLRTTLLVSLYFVYSLFFTYVYVCMYLYRVFFPHF
jgi:hypothetical protein